MRRLLLNFGVIVICFVVGIPSLSQTEQDLECDAAQLANQREVFASILQVSADTDSEQALANLFRLGQQYQELALNCGYTPNEVETQALIASILRITDVATIIAANSVGTDVDEIVEALDSVDGDLTNGQLLYNGLEDGLDGAPLGCSGCHTGNTAPTTEGTWTRFDEIRQHDPNLENYTFAQYMVESIVAPNDYVAEDEGWLANLMPSTYGTRLELQQLADIIAYLDSQDQLLEGE